MRGKIQPYDQDKLTGRSSCNCSHETLPKKTTLDTLEITSEFRPGKESKNTLDLRRNSKAISQAINGKLCYQESKIHKDYQSAYYCNEYLFQDGKKFTANFCKKRNCLVCSRIYAARLFKAYSKPLFELDDLHMVTLTAPTVTADKLKDEINKRYASITRIKDNLRKTHQIRIKGFRKLEITYNPNTKKFHPHYHILIQGKEAAELVRSYWLKLNPDADKKAQNVKKVESEKALFEVFKYVTKQIVKDTFCASSLDEMYKAIKGIRTCQSFGIKKLQDVKIDDYESVVLEHKTEKIDVWKWCNDNSDWYTADGEQLNTGDINPQTKKSIKIIKGHDKERAKKNDDKDTWKYDFTKTEKPNPGQKIAYFDD